MNDPISWDPSLVKKFSSSNHYKLLNQLRNEVKKYPLNNKKKTSSIQSNNSNLDNKKSSNSAHTHISSLSNKSNQINDENGSKSTVSFNNAKNFSIYNQITNSSIRIQNKSYIQDQLISEANPSSQTLKDRLNQIEMK